MKILLINIECHKITVVYHILDLISFIVFFADFSFKFEEQVNIYDIKIALKISLISIPISTY